MIKYTKRLTRPYVRAVQGGYRSMRHSISEKSPPWLSRRLDPMLDYVDLILVDHGIFRMIYPNRHRLAAHAWRSSQPSPRDIRRMARRGGLKTIVNLRGDRDCGSYRLETEACRRYGVKLVDFSVKSRQAPAKDTFRAAKELFDSVEYPILLHCKSGADRVGLMSVLYMILKEGRPVAEARRQLSLRYGHIRQADTGVLDLVFDSYLAHSSREPIAFLDWVDRHYDERIIAQRFRAEGWANLMVNRIINRE
ncbi:MULTISPECIES: sulfur transferase domain-containing protein [Rhodomicrobium]|uniref:fused DSP-PTPase phosphatase/NAD kinase-like protein n=1 Tax=Rhodomicrobium TaxID=1068 RepID=UPI000B4A8B4C|nr:MULTISPECIES: sulfur transferase domain-containing protein [Rhodomicrobium]